MTYSEALAWLYSTQHFGIKLGLENIHRLLGALDVKNQGQRILHVAGTNGKGSVCAMLDSICRAEGYCTGLYTSPHLVEFRERIRINGQMISEEAAAAGLSRIRQIAASWEHSPTFFEIVTALALAYFDGRLGGLQRPVEIVVLETGLGGRLDATNAVTPVAVVFTPIDFDHQAYLGNTLASIAGEKAGIIKPGVPAASASQPEEAAAVFRETARRQNAPLEFVVEPLKGYEVGLAGAHQLSNAALALKALELAQVRVSQEAVRSGLREVQWPGRFQIFPSQHGGKIVLDGAHNKAAASQLARTWSEVFGDAKATVILGILRDKDSAAICQALAPITGRLIATAVRSERSCSPQEVRAAFQAVNKAPVPIELAADFPSALGATAGTAPTLITGSLFLVGEALAYFEGAQTRPTLQ